MKALRQAKILELIQTETIETQDELAERLKAYGIESTQATISRDIKELRLIKTQSERGGYQYATPEQGFEKRLDDKLQNIFRESVTSVANAQNIVVIKTLPGLAPAACAAVDAMRLHTIVGTLAGDDTGFILLRDSVDARTFCGEVRALLQA
ncbi:arginine repressor [Oscillospiraceae bacterium OttesenSCG-928-F05]|nr:arginine repressor [Oscillospiraceae bacterium OttesenSCG-928-F05]